MAATDKEKVLNFYKNKTVLITGSTGFKGSWLTHILLSSGAKVIGYALEPPTDPNLFTIAGLENCFHFHQIYGDIRELDELIKTFRLFQPEIVFHLAAQPIVRESFKEPVDTYFTNVMGTVNICEAVRQTSSVCSFLNITTDKVYRNVEWEYGYRECDELNGLDPYSNSKSCSELVTHSYRDSFFKDNRVKVSTARAGNVIGGGDFANDRIIPDCVRALLYAKENKTKAIIRVRNPYSTRPYEHVLEPLFAYLLIAKAQYEDQKFTGCYNVGPDDVDCVTTSDLVSIFCDIWNGMNTGVTVAWTNEIKADAPYEANFLKLDCSKIKAKFGWRPRWHIEGAVKQTVKFTKTWMDGGDPTALRAEMDRELVEFIKE